MENHLKMNDSKLIELARKIGKIMFKRKRL